MRQSQAQRFLEGFEEGFEDQDSSSQSEEKVEYRVWRNRTPDGVSEQWRQALRDAERGNRKGVYQDEYVYHAG